jgi:septal ring factor EnvC (AmiA/AmiB activator)
MSRRLPIGNCRWLRLGAAALALAFTVGCAGGPSQKELSALEQKRQATESAENLVAEKKAEKARLERTLAERKDEKKSQENRLATTQQCPM